MKNITILLLFIGLSAFSQELVRNEIDEFTGKHVKETKWVTLNKKSSIYSYVKLMYVNGKYVLRFKMMSAGVFAVREGENFYLKLETEEILKLYVMEYELTTYGAGATGLIGKEALGLELHIKISPEQIDLLSKYLIIKTRVVTTDGYHEAEAKSKQAKNVMAIAKLIIN